MPDTNKINFDLPADTPLAEKYSVLLTAVRQLITSHFPQVGGRPPLQIFLPPTLLAYADATHSSLRNIDRKYATTDIRTGQMWYAPRHQEDVAGFSGVLNGENQNEVDAVKTMVHETLHMVANKPYFSRGEQIINELLTEVMALAFTAHYFSFSTDADTFAETLYNTRFYRDRFPWFAFVLMGVWGRPLDILSHVQQLYQAGNPAIQLQQLTQAVSSTYGLRSEDGLDFLVTEEERYDDRMKDVMNKIKANADKVKPSEIDPLMFLIRGSIEN